MPQFVCALCAKDFEVPQTALDKFPGWQPKACLRCKNAKAKEDGKPTKNGEVKQKKRRSTAGASATREQDLTVAEVLERYTQGPEDGVFTDGASHPNPGPGGWGAVYVKGGAIIAEAMGAVPEQTTNNRMELSALIAAFELVPDGESATIYTDSQLCVNTITKWAPGWEEAGWTRKTGAIKNLDLVKQLYKLAKARPELKLQWIKAHSGFRWNEYADALATAYRRGTK